MFTIYPALDLRNGRVVRLKQGRAADETIYSDDPAAIAQQWVDDGATWLHIVDLDRAFGVEASPNRDALKSILGAVDVPIQLGGGMRDLATMQRALEQGVSRVILGTVAVEQPALVADAVREFGAERIVIGIDARNGIVATRGWVESSGIDAREFGKRMRDLGATRALLTDIAKDGMLQSVDAAAMADFARATDLNLIASGGVATLDDIRALVQVAPIGVEGVIVGQALYTHAFTLPDALRIAQPVSETRAHKPRICEG